MAGKRGVAVPGLLGELDAMVGQDGVDLVRHGLKHVLQELPGRLSVSSCIELSDGELGRSINAQKEIELYIPDEARASYVDRICEFVDIFALKQLKTLVNAGHGTAGPTFNAISERLEILGAPLLFERLFHEPDGTFPTRHSQPAPTRKPTRDCRHRSRFKC